MSGWEEIKLHEITQKIGSGATPRGGANSYKESGIPLIRSQNVLDLSFSTNGLAFIDEEQASKLNNVIVQESDLLLNITGDSVARICKVPSSMVSARVNQHVAIIRVNNKVADPNYILYYLQTAKPHLLSISEIGGTRRALTKGMIEELDIPSPPLPEQKAIASVLSSLDDKIDLLHRQNNTLDAMAETLFRQWFVEEADESWEEVELQDIATVQNGHSFSSKAYVDFLPEHLEVFKMGHIEPGGGLRFTPKANFVPRSEKLKKWVLNKGDIVMAMTDMKDSMGILAHPAMIDIDDKYVLNQRVARIYVTKDDKLINNHFLYMQLKTDVSIAILQSKAHGGVQVNLSTEAIKTTPVLIPPKDIQEKWMRDYEHLLLKTELNRKNVFNLEKLRDTLLPKLLSGEVKVGI